MAIFLMRSHTFLVSTASLDIVKIQLRHGLQWHNFSTQTYLWCQISNCCPCSSKL